MPDETSTRDTGCEPDHRTVPRQYLLPFILVTSLFALWGFANDVTNPMVRSFEDVFRLTASQGSLVQLNFYFGYAIIAIPAALVIRKTSFKTGIAIGLSLYACGALLFWPASQMRQFNLFLICFMVITFGLGFLETAANPYILSMGPPETATRRLNLAQAFNPMGSLMGMLVAMFLVLPMLQANEFRQEHLNSHPEYATLKRSEIESRVQDAINAHIAANPSEHQTNLDHDLGVIRQPYLMIGAVVASVLLLFLVSKMPDTGCTETPLPIAGVLTNLANFRFLGGVAAQTAYVGAQICCWTYIIHYGMTQLGWTAQQSQLANVFAMTCNLCFRWVWTFVLRFASPGRLLGMLAIGAMSFCLGAAYLPGLAGLISLVATSTCMSAMFPTIYGIALKEMSVEEAKLASAGLIIAISGGGIMPFCQSQVIDASSINFLGLTDSMRASFLVPAACFAFVCFYGFSIDAMDKRCNSISST